jgi:multidrug efflux system membrane fusion protein
VDVLHGATVIPTSAVQHGAPGTFVYLVNQDSTVTARPVALGPSSNDHVAVQSGVSPGDRVVVDGADRLRDGAMVAVRAPDRANSPASPARQPPQAAP